MRPLEPDESFGFRGLGYRVREEVRFDHSSPTLDFTDGVCHHFGLALWFCSFGGGGGKNLTTFRCKFVLGKAQGHFSSCVSGPVCQDL